MAYTYSCAANPYPEPQKDPPQEEGFFDKLGATWDATEPDRVKAAGLYDDYYMSLFRKPYELAERYLPDTVATVESGLSQAADATSAFLSDQWDLMGTTYGKPLGDAYEDAKEISGAYLKENAPLAYEGFLRRPTLLRLTFGLYMDWAMSNMSEYKSESKDMGLPKPLQNQISYLSETMIPSEDACLNSYAQARFGEVVPFADDDGLRPFYNVVPLNTDTVNAFNTGTTIYITRGAIESLADDAEVNSVLAHEISHGDQEHAIENMLTIGGLSIVHMAKLMFDEGVWVLTGKIRPRLRTVMNEGNLAAILSDYAPLAPGLEIEADVGAVEILKLAGKSARDMKSALIRLHGLNPDELLTPENIPESLGAGSGDKVREYPSLRERLEAIDAAAR